MHIINRSECLGAQYTYHIYIWTYMDRRAVHITFNYYNCSFSPLWTTSCFFRSWADQHALLHWVHLYGFSLDEDEVELGILVVGWESSREKSATPKTAWPPFLPPPKNMGLSWILIPTVGFVGRDWDIEPDTRLSSLCGKHMEGSYSTTSVPTRYWWTKVKKLYQRSFYEPNSACLGHFSQCSQYLCSNAINKKNITN